jgi:uncharacterized protein with beta-barrel porin domain
VAAGLLASLALPLDAKAQDATWLLNPGSGNFNSSTNWTPATVPSGTAFFGASNTTTITFSSSTNLDTFQFNAGAAAFTFMPGANHLAFSGVGIVNNSGAAQTFLNDAGDGIATLTFFNASTAGNATITNTNGAGIFFGDASTAGGATITNSGGSTSFTNGSMAGTATITNNSGGHTQFNHASTGGTATIINNSGGLTDFLDTSTAGSATIINNSGGAARFFGTSTAGDGVIVNENGGRTRFFFSSTAGAVTLITRSGGTTEFAATSSGGTASLFVNGGGTLDLANHALGSMAAGSVRQAAGSFYRIAVNGAGQTTALALSGTATLLGATVVLQAAPGLYGPSTTYTILTATGGLVGSGFAGVTGASAFLVPTLSYDTNNVFLTLTRGFAQGAQTTNQRAVGAILDQANASGDFAAVLNAMLNLDTAQGPQVLQVLSGQNYSAFGSLMIQGAQLFMDSFSLHAGGGVSGGGAGLPGGSSYMALKAVGSGACETACDLEPLWGAWGGGLGAFGTVTGDGNASGVTYNLGGFAAGIDRRFAPNFKAGIATGFNAASLYTNGMPGTGTSNTLQVALYGELIEGPFYLDGLAGYAHSDNRLTRPLVIPGLPFRSAQGYTTANTLFGQLEAGYKLMVAPSFGGFVTPFARLQASTSTQAGFSETGADSLNLTVAAQTTQSLRTVFGAQLGAGIDAPWREKLNAVMRLGWSHEFADQTRPVNAAFAGAPTLGFTTFGAAAPRDGVVLGLGANTAIAEATSLYFRYDGNLAGGNTNHVLSAGVRYVW